MDKETINKLRGLVYEYCLEKRNSYHSGTTVTYNELNKGNYEKLSGFVNWIQAESLETPATKSTKQPKLSPQRKQVSNE